MCKRDQQVNSLLNVFAAFAKGNGNGEDADHPNHNHHKPRTGQPSEIKRGLTRKALNFRDFDGGSKQTFKCWLGDSKSKVSVLGNIGDVQFLRMLHSKIP